MLVTISMRSPSRCAPNLPRPSSPSGVRPRLAVSPASFILRFTELEMVNHPFSRVVGVIPRRRSCRPGEGASRLDQRVPVGIGLDEIQRAGAELAVVDSHSGLETRLQGPLLPATNRHPQAKFKPRGITPGLTRYESETVCPSEAVTLKSLGRCVLKTARSYSIYTQLGETDSVTSPSTHDPRRPVVHNCQEVRNAHRSPLLSPCLSPIIHGIARRIRLRRADDCGAALQELAQRPTELIGPLKSLAADLCPPTNSARTDQRNVKD